MLQAQKEFKINLDILQTALVSIIPPTLHFGISKAKFAEKNPNTLAAGADFTYNMMYALFTSPPL